MKLCEGHGGALEQISLVSVVVHICEESVLELAVAAAGRRGKHSSGAVSCYMEFYTGRAG